MYKIRQWSLPGAAVVPVLNVSSRVFWLELDDKLFWTAILCYRKAFFVMFSRRSVQQHGRARQVKGLRSPLCCRAVKMQMTGLTSCCLKRTSGPPLQPGGLSQRRFPNRPFARSDPGAKGKKLICRSLLEVLVGVNVSTSGHAIGNADTASYYVSISLLLGKHRRLGYVLTCYHPMARMPWSERPL